MSSSRKISSQFVKAVGFSNGCAEFTFRSRAVGAELLDDLLAATGRR